MADTTYTGPALGDKGSEADINTANQWMRAQPWYQDFLRSIGQNPNKVQLNGAQKQQLALVVAQHGLPVPAQDEIDPSGNINPKGHKLRNFLIGAAIGGAALTGLGAAGIGPLSGLAGGGAAAGGSLGSMVPGAEGGLAAGAGGAAAGGTAAGVGTTAASTGFGAALKSALPAIIGAGATVGGSAIAAHGNTEAAKAQAAATEKAAQIQADQLDRALAQAKYIYQTQRSGLSGYRSGGNNALGALSFGLGLPAPSFDAPPVDPSIANPPPSTVVAPGAVDANGRPLPGAGQNQTIPPPPTMAQQTSTANGGLIPMKNPQTGIVKLIPPSDVQACLAAGGVPANGV